MSRKPNVLFFFTDDQRFDTIAALGNEEISTPNIDKLVHRGVAFTHGHIPGGTSGAVCMPSRAMVNSGKTLFHLCDEGQTIPVDHTTIGEAFQSAGYRTFGTGKWHNGRKAYARSFTEGGEIFFGGMWDHWNVPAYNFDPTGKYNKKSRAVMDPFHTNNIIENYCDHVHLGKHSSELFCDLAVDFLNDYDKKDPFYMYVALMAPHDPRTMPEEFKKMYDPEKIKLPENFMNEHPFEYGQKVERDEELASYPRKEKEVRKHIAEYYGMISHLDHEFGRVMDALEKSGELDNTIIVFSGDNGLALGQHGLMGKQNLYEHSVRVPLIFAGPSIPKDKVTNKYAYLLDIYPTLCDLCGIDIPESVDGKSLVPAIKEDKVVRPTMYLAFNDKIRGVKNDKYKLIEYRYNELKETQLFDLENDRWELNNLYGKEEYKPIVEQLRKDMVELRDEWDDLDHRYGKKFWSLF